MANGTRDDFSTQLRVAIDLESKFGVNREQPTG